MPGQCSQVVSTTYSYTPEGFTRSATVSDQTGALTTTSSYDEAGNLIGRTAPYTGSAAPVPSTAFAYDEFNRLVAVGRSTATLGAGLGPAQQGVNGAVVAFWYGPATVTTPAVATSYGFASPSTVYGSGSISTASDDVTQSVAYIDGLGRTVQTRTRMGGTSAGALFSQITASLGANNWMVAGDVRFDAAGRVSAAASTYLAPSGGSPLNLSYVLPAGTMVSSAGYDERGRAICSIQGPGSGLLLGNVPAPSAQCTSLDAESSSRQLATRTTYGADSSQGRPFFTVSSQPTWRNIAHPPVSYLDRSGRVLLSIEADGATRHVLGENLDEQWTSTTTSGSGKAVRQKSWFDKRGRTIQQVDDDGTIGGYARIKRFTYLPGGEIASASTANGASGMDYLYGSLGRLRGRIDFGVATPGSSWMRYDAPYAADFSNTSGRIAQSYTCLGTADCGGGVAATRQAFSYNGDGALLRKDAWWDDVGGAYSVQRTVRNDGLELSTTVTGPALTTPVVTTSWYDSARRPVRISDAVSGAELWRAQSGYDGLGRVTESRMDDNHLQAAVSFSPYSGLPTEFMTKRGDGTGTVFPADDIFHAGSFKYEGSKVTEFSELVSSTKFTNTYDDSGRLTNAVALPLANPPRLDLQQDFNETYSFNDLQSSPNASPWNLTTVSRKTSTQSVPTVATYGYAGNPSEQLTSVGYTTGAASGGADGVTSDIDRGLVTSVALKEGGTLGLIYDASMRLVKITRDGSVVEVLSYDAAGQLAKRSLGANGSEVRRYLDAALTLVTTNGITTAWVHVGSQQSRLASIPRGPAASATLYYHRDRLGSVVATTIAGGAVGAMYRYDVYGQLERTAGEGTANASELGYTSGLRLSEGLLHLQARAYSARLRRFVQPDNVDGRRYSYANGDPVNRVDPSGHRAMNPAGPYNGSGLGCMDGGRCTLASGITLYVTMVEVEGPARDREEIGGPESYPLQQWLDDQEIAAERLHEDLMSAMGGDVPTWSVGNEAIAFGAGMIVVGASAEAGIPGLGAGASASAGYGFFYNINAVPGEFPMSGGMYVTYAAMADAGGTGFAMNHPTGDTGIPFVVGGSAGLGNGWFITNASSGRELTGAFESISFNWSFGVGFGMNFSYGSGTWMFSMTGRLPGVGLSFSSYPSDTIGITNR